MNFLNNLKNSVARALFRMGFSANFISVLGLWGAALTGLFIYRGQFFAAALMMLVSGILDLLDGAVARLSPTKSSFGGILDSTLDRYGDSFIYLGIIFFYATGANWLYSGLAASALVGSFVISYVRARAECVIPQCRVGFWERGERLVYLALGLLFNNLRLVLWVLGIATHFTALFRLAYAKNSSPILFSKKNVSGPLNFLFHTQGRRHPYYLIKAVFLFCLVAFFRVL